MHIESVLTWDCLCISRHVYFCFLVLYLADCSLPQGISHLSQVSKAGSPGLGNCEDTLPLASNGIPDLSRRKNGGPSARMRNKSSQSDSGSSNAKNLSESSDSEMRPLDDGADVELPSSPSKSKLPGKCGAQKRNSKRIAEHVPGATRKRQRKMMTSNLDAVASGSLSSKDLNLPSNSRIENEVDNASLPKMKSPSNRRSRMKSPALDNERTLQVANPGCPQRDVLAIQPLATSRKEDFAYERIDDKSWKTLEKALYEKGLEIFGRNRLVYL